MTLFEDAYVILVDSWVDALFHGARKGVHGSAPRAVSRTEDLGCANAKARVSKRFGRMNLHQLT